MTGSDLPVCAPARAPPEPELPALRASRPSGFAIRDNRGFAAEGESDFGIEDAVDPDPDAEEETTFDIDILN